jgi:uncharacterized protein
MNRSGTSFEDDYRLHEDVRKLYEEADPAHDFAHILRVCKNARSIGEQEGADMQVLLLSALLHDAGSVSKSAKRSASSIGNLKTVENFLINKGILKNVMEKVLYAVEVHSFSKGIMPATLEAKILQDADRLDAIGIKCQIS